LTYTKKFDIIIIEREEKKMKKMLVFDMDGTIADLYGVDGWLDDLHNEKTRPYDDAKPLYNMTELVELLNRLRTLGWLICVTTWLAKDATKEYNKAVTKAKKDWLAKYNFPNHIHEFSKTLVAVYILLKLNL
jgi:hypothetical protein